MLRVTPIYGSSLSSSSSNNDDNPLEWLSSPVPSCTLVEYAGVRLLLNVGWDESLPSATSTKSPIPNNLPDGIDAILLCDSTLSSLGGLPKYFTASKKSKRARAPRSSNEENNQQQGDGGSSNKKRQRNPPFLATYPTVKMGQMTMYDHHASLSLDGANPGYSLEDVDAVFSKDSFHTLKYSQTVYLPLEDGDDTMDGNAMDIDSSTNQKQKLTNSKTSNKSLAITPHLSGHVVGGCYWVLKQLSDDTEIILAPTYHHAKEKHLAGSTLHKFGLNADALLTMPGGPRGLLGKLYQPPPTGEQNKDDSIIKYKKGNKPILSSPVGNRSEAELIEGIMAALRRDGNVLLPVDASGRVLELLLVLDRHWEKQRLGGAYNLVWVGPMSLNTIEFARAQLEWMAAPLGTQFDARGIHPYGLKSVKICSSVGELENVIERSNGNPTCVLASGASMDHGPARDLLIKWSGNPDNLVLITDSTRCVPRGDVWFDRDGGKKVTSTADTTPAVIEETAEGEDKDGNQQLGPALVAGDVSAYTTSSQLLYHWCSAKAKGEEMPDEVSVDVYVPHRAPLSGRELQTFLAQEEEERRLKKADMEERAMMKEIELARGRLRLGGDGDDDKTTSASKTTGTSNTAGSKSKATTGGASRPKKKSRFDQSLFIKFSKPVHMTFDVREEAVGIGQPDAVAKYGIVESMSGKTGILEDDYGISVKADSFVDIVTGVDPSRYAGRSGKVGEEVQKRGLGFGNFGGSESKPISMNTVSGKGATDLGVVTDDGEGGDEGVNEKMLEVADLSSGKGIIKGRNGRPPIKVSAIARRLEILAEVVYTPLEGRVDARAARQSVRALQPRHLVVIGGPRENALMLADALRTTTISMGASKNASTKGSSAHVLIDGEMVQLTVGHAAYGVRLIDTPYLTPEAKEGMELAGKEIEPVEPQESKIGDCSVSLVDFVATGKKWAVDGSVVLAPRQHQSTLKQPSLMLSTREVLLTDLRAEITALGMKAEYGALSGYSRLIVNGKIVVRKDNNSGKLNVEGPLCSDFYTVRSIVCGQYVTLT